MKTVAQEEARALAHGSVGPEHILLALVRADEQALRHFDVDAERVRDEVHRAMAASRANERSAVKIQPDSALVWAPRG